MEQYDIIWDATKITELTIPPEKKRKVDSIFENQQNNFKIIKKSKEEEPELFQLTDNSVFRVGTEIHFTDQINKTSIQKMIRLISNIIHEHINDNKNNDARLEIVYIVDSPGGSVTSVLKFVDFLRIVRSKYKFVEFTSIITGFAASAGTIMAICADKRVMTKNSFAMIHELSSGTFARMTHFLTYTDYLKKLNNNLIDIYCNVTKKSVDEIEILLNKETWFSAEEYLNNKFVDEIK